MSKKDDDEIDLVQLLKTSIISVKKRFAFLVFFTLVGLLGGATSSYFTPKRYTSFLTVRSDFLEPILIEKMISYFNLVINSQERDSKIVFSMTKEEEAKVLSVEVKEVLGTQQYNVIEASVLDVSVLPKLEKDILAFFNSNQYIKEKIINEKKRYKKIMQAIESDIHEKEKIRTRLNSLDIGNAESSQDAYLIEKDGLVDLVEKKESLLQNTNSSSSIEVLQSFIVHSKSYYPRPRLFMIYGSLIGVLVGLSFAIILDNQD